MDGWNQRNLIRQRRVATYEIIIPARWSQQQRSVLAIGKSSRSDHSNMAQTTSTNASILASTNPSSIATTQPPLKHQPKDKERFLLPKIFEKQDKEDKVKMEEKRAERSMFTVQLLLSTISEYNNRQTQPKSWLKFDKLRNKPRNNTDVH